MKIALDALSYKCSLLVITFVPMPTFAVFCIIRDVVSTLDVEVFI